MKDIITTIFGNVTKDAAESTTKDGHPGAKVRIAVTPRYFDGSDREWKDRKSEFVTVFARKGLARNVLQSLKKGQPVMAHGRLSSNTWTQDDGTPAFSLVMNADAIGHDLTFGSSAFIKAPRYEDVPDIDSDTHESLEREGPSSDADAPYSAYAEHGEDESASSPSSDAIREELKAPAPF